MSEFILTCCSTADMSKEYFTKRNIKYVCFTYQIDGVEYPDDLGESMSYSDFYAKIAAGAMPITAQVNEERYFNFWEKLLNEEKDKDILHISLSSGLSGSYNSALIAKREIEEKYPTRKVYVVDSLAASSGYGLLMDAIADLRDSGASAEEAANWTEENKLKLHHWFFSTNLTHFKRGGRLSAPAAFFGTILSICPLMNMDNNGKLTIRQKILGKKHVLRAIVQKMRDLADDRTDYSGKCFICHSELLPVANELKAAVEASFPNLKEPVTINSIGTVIGSHSGPGTVSLFFFGDKREN